MHLSAQPTFSFKLVLLLLTLTSPLLLPPPARADNLETAFQNGLGKFRAGEYAAALQQFEFAVNSGMNTPQLHYNLAVCHYRLEQLDAAAEQFRQLRDDPKLGDIAHYNLGLIALKQEHYTAARNEFNQVRQNSHQTALLTLAKRSLAYIDTLQPDQHQSPANKTLPIKPHWSGQLSSAIGFDDNVILDSDLVESSTNRDDSFHELFLYAQRPLHSDTNQALLVEGVLYALNHNQKPDYDTDMVQLGLLYNRPLSNWQSQSALLYNRIHFGNTPFLASAILRLQADRPLGPLHHLQLRAEHHRLDALESNYAYLNGSQQRLEINDNWGFDNWRFRSGYRYESNDRKNRISNGLFTSSSPIRHQLKLEAGTLLKPDLQSSFKLYYRYSDYQQASDLNNQLSRIREDNRLRWILSVDWRLEEQAQLSLIYQRTSNRSNIDSYSYTRNRFMVKYRLPW